jgi:methanogenic corrinoid protein MtbC1
MAALFPARHLIHRVIVPLMTELGERWYRGDLRVAQEHMVSAALRNLVGSLVRLFTRTQPKTSLLFATPKGEMHEFGILCAAMLAGAGGLGVAYLGVNLPSAEIIGAARKTGTEVVVLSVKAAVSGKASMKELHRISEGLPASTELWVGGVRSPHIVKEINTTRARYLRDLTILEQELARLGARF